MTDLPEGRELDALIAEKVMGEPRLAEPVLVGVPGHIRELWWKHRDEVTEEPPCYSTDIAAAWQVVGHLTDNDVIFSLLYGDTVEMSWSCQFTGIEFGRVQAEGESAPLAICRAALKYLEGE